MYFVFSLYCVRNRIRENLKDIHWKILTFEDLKDEQRHANDEGAPYKLIPVRRILTEIYKF